MSDPALPRIKVTDAQNLEGAASPVDTPSTTTDGGQSARPRSATSSEGMSFSMCRRFRKSDTFHTSTKDDQMIWLLFLALLLVRMLTGVFTTGNTQSNGKKSPINLIRNASSKDASVAKPSPAPGRPSTAIDPLSHVRSRLLQVSYISRPIPANTAHRIDGVHLLTFGTAHSQEDQHRKYNTSEAAQ